VPAESAALRLATRGSALALAQARLVAGLLERAEPGLSVELVPVRTSGDERPGAGVGGSEEAHGGGTRGSSPGGGAGPAHADPGDKSRFVKEIEDTLLAGDADLAVHSAKDVPGELPEGLAIVGVPARADARDALCGAGSLEALAPGARVGTSSLRRRAQLLAARKDLEVVDLRGNVDTRLRRLSEGEYDAIVLARAGLERLGLSDGDPIGPEAMTPAPGQGCLALEARAGDERIAELAAAITDREALVCLTAERTVARGVGASCRTPIGVHATWGGLSRSLAIDCFVGVPSGDAWIRDRVEGGVEDPRRLGHTGAERLRAAGAADLFSE